MSPKNFRIPIEKQISARLDHFLSEGAIGASRSQITKWIKSGAIVVNGKSVKPGYLIQQGDVIEGQFSEFNSDQISHYNFNLEIFYEDDDLLVVNKPAGLVVHPSAGHLNDTLVNALSDGNRNLSVGTHSSRPGIVHRIDRDTSGLLVVAKNTETHEGLSKQFKSRTVHRIYLAMVYGRPARNYRMIESNLGRHPKDRKRFASVPVGGKNAITEYWLLDFKKDLSLLRLKLGTGRTHQIRVHLSEMGHPIIGDTLYAKSSRAKAVGSKD
ncbi:MAG: RluA family pseudouridine synthase, partial [Bdellovibrionales bacterium]|nr:RluA family pseudouridine synthase [Bdellovibrionales bacterium]